MMLAVGSVGELYKHLGEFLEAVRSEPSKRHVLLYSNRLVGGLTEEIGLEYTPAEGFIAWANLYSERGIPVGEVGEVLCGEIRREKEADGFAVSGGESVKFNPATDEYVGYGWALTGLPEWRRTAVSVETLEKMLNAVIEFAGHLAEEALEDLVVPAHPESA